MGTHLLRRMRRIRRREKKKKKKGSRKGAALLDQVFFFSSIFEDETAPKTYGHPRAKGRSDRGVVLNNRARRRIKGRPEQDAISRTRKKPEKKRS